MRTRVLVMTTMLATSLVVMGCSESAGRVAAPTSPTPPPVTVVPPPPAPPPGCNALKAEFSVGQSASDDLLERARVAAGAGSARFIRPNEIITLEFLASRLNVNLDAKDVVRSVTCG